MKRKISKKVLCLCMVAVLAIGFAIPTFASGAPHDALVSGKSYVFRPGDNVSSLLVNVYGNGNPRDNVTLYKPTNQNDQRWRLESAGSGSFYVATALAPTLGWNINHTGNNCNLHAYRYNYTDNKDDSAVVFQTINNGIKLRDWPLYMYNASASVDANITWFTNNVRSWNWSYLGY